MAVVLFRRCKSNNNLKKTNKMTRKCSKIFQIIKKDPIWRPEFLYYEPAGIKTKRLQTLKKV